LISYYIDPAKCAACTLCYRNCPVDAVEGERGKIHVIDQAKCIKCGTCFEVCPPAFRAVQKLSGKPVPPPIPEEQRWIKKGGKAINEKGVAN
jgi:Fe-S-cluster-containing hydrogenase component 2